MNNDERKKMYYYNSIRARPDTIDVDNDNNIWTRMFSITRTELPNNIIAEQKCITQYELFYKERRANCIKMYNELSYTKPNKSNLYKDQKPETRSNL